MKRIVTLIALMLCGTVVLAQDEQTPLLDILNAVPDQTEFRQSMIGYVDLRAMVEARKGAVTPDSWDTLRNDKSGGTGLYMAALRGIGYGPPFLSNLFAGGDLWEETIGVDFLTLDQVLYFGTPPTDVNVLVGDFDMDAIAAAHTARHYTSEPLGDFTLWCGEVGCENGSQINLENRNQGNPFGGDFGREQPFIASDSMIINSADMSLLNMAADAVTDHIHSLADNANYVTAVHSINTDNILIQTVFIHPSQILLDTAPLVMDNDTDTIEALMTEAANLPPYNLLMIADTANDTEQVVYVSLVYPSLEDAQTAIEVVPSRLEMMQSMQTEQTYRELFEGRDVTDIIVNAVMDESTDLAVAVLEFHAPLASDEPDDTLGYVASSMVYRLVIDMVLRRDTNWLITG